MEEIFYEKHTYRIYKGEKMPFICHKDFALSDGYGITVNWHENPEFLCCLSGVGEVFADSEKYPFEEGTIITVNPNSTHGIMGVSRLVYDCLIVDYQFCKDNGIDVGSLQFYEKISDKKAVEKFKRAMESCTEESPFQSLKARSSVLDFLLYMCENHIKPFYKFTNLSGVEEIKKVMLYVRNNYKNEISLEQASKIAGFSVYHFSREFKRVTGLTFITFLNTVRCQNAAKMLQKGKSVTEVCFACGFKELSHFSRTFTKIMGVTPSSLHKT